MDIGSLRKVLSTLFLALIIVCPAAVKPLLALAEPGTNPDNRFNVVMVVDASGSMKTTDPNGLRFEAIDQFAFLLADSGNKLGGVVFTSDIAAVEDLAPANSSSDKDRVTAGLASVQADGDTNIGAALDTAVRMIEKDGDSKLSSVILLLSDGNTDLPGASKDELQKSLDQKAASVQTARGKNIPIYSVCLNADNTANLSEMQQISSATNGLFLEVKRPEDLKNAFNVFYGLIYGSAISIKEAKFPTDGKLETDFIVPGIGVEEVNIIISGHVTSYAVKDPNGKDVPFSVATSDSITMLKITDVSPGTWKLITEGVPGEAVQINMVFNTNLDIEAAVEPKAGTVNPEDSILVKAFLVADGSRAKKANQYTGFEAELVVFDTFDEQVETVPMALAKDHFEVSHQLPEGNYKFKIHVSGNSLDRTTDYVGEMLVSSETLSDRAKNNHPPKPVEDPKEDTVFIWPFRENSYTLDLATLATDEDGDELQYKVVSSSFMKDDYNVDNNTLNLTNFSMSTGAFTVRAVDVYGKTCDIEVIVKSHNVGILALIGIGVLALIGVVVFVVLLRIALSKPFRGSITAESVVDGAHSMPKTIKGGRGRLPLARFNLSPTGLNYSKSYLQATGGRIIILNTNQLVEHNGQQTKKIEINAGAPVTVIVSPGKQLMIRFDSLVSPGSGSGFSSHGGSRSSSGGGFGSGSSSGGFGSGSSSGGFGSGSSSGSGGFGDRRRPPKRPTK